MEERLVWYDGSKGGPGAIQHVILNPMRNQGYIIKLIIFQDSVFNSHQGNVFQLYFNYIF